MAGFKWSSLTKGQLVAMDRFVRIPHFDDTLTTVVEVDLDPVNITLSAFETVPHQGAGGCSQNQ